MKCNLFLLCAAAAIATVRSVPRMGRIVGGTEAVRGEFPWQSMIKAVANGQTVSYCGGALISRDFVLTGAQCVEGATRLEVYLGAHNISRVNEPNRVILNATIYTVHENFTWDNFDNDIAMVHLPRSISRTPYIDYIKIPTGADADDGFVGWYGTIAGWGFTRDGENKLHDVLRYSFNEVVDPSVCVTNYGAGWMNPNKLCISTQGGRGPCYGDAGGPVIKTNEDGSSTIMGLFSFLDTDSCQRGKPLGFTRVGAYVDWMRQVSGFVPV